MSLATSLPVSVPLDAALYEKNMVALRESLPETADRLHASTGPSSLGLTQGRDAAPTYSWIESDRRTYWLGRTTMPTLRAPALVDAFHTGDGNVLLAGFGQGAEVDLLRRRLAPHQAVMVVEENAWAAECVLRLYDFSAELLQGRLLLFVGPDAWQGLERFLVEHDGYVEPLRILSWPWFDAPQVAEVSQRLSGINSRLAAHRAAEFGVSVARKPLAKPKAQKPIVAVLSTVADSRIRRASEVLEIAAESLGWASRRFVLQNPAVVHPIGIRRALDELAPSVCLLLDVTPAMLPYPLPEAPAFVLCAHAEPLSEQWLAQLGSNARLGVVNEMQRAQAVGCGVPDSNIMLVPPAAQAGLNAGTRSARSDETNVLVIADRIDPSAEAAGLHLASHRRLWDAATAILTSQCDLFDDDQAAGVLAAAEKQCKIQLSSDDVRSGLMERIRRRLGPSVVCSEYLQALRKKGVAFDLYGSGWENDATFVSHFRGTWPSPREVPDLLTRYRTMIVFDAVGRPFEPLLDALAAGLVGLYRDVGGRQLALDSVDLAGHAFASRSDLLQRLNRGGTPRADLIETINEQHTWAGRLQSIAKFCQVD